MSIGRHNGLKRRTHTLIYDVDVYLILGTPGMHFVVPGIPVLPTTALINRNAYPGIAQQLRSNFITAPTPTHFVEVYLAPLAPKSRILASNTYPSRQYSPRARVTLNTRRLLGPRALASTPAPGDYCNRCVIPETLGSATYHICHPIKKEPWQLFRTKNIQDSHFTSSAGRFW